MRGRNVFSREHLAEVFESAYTTLPVKFRTLESLANFKDLVKPVTGRIYNIISKFQAFKISKEGSAIVVEVKKKMHHDDWLGFTSDGKTVGSGEDFAAWRLMRERSVRLEETPPYLLKAVDAEIIHKIEIRQRHHGRDFPPRFLEVSVVRFCFRACFFIDGYNLCQRMESCNASTYRVNPSPPPPPGMSLDVFLCLSFSGSSRFFSLYPLPGQNQAGLR